ncbi:MAG: AtpZ/AtpI family protein [Candidatus Moranbacteria bacterium]|nr:AtpZ/AtpI family protein [Candidatus Moranbacteria bacterium]
MGKEIKEDNGFSALSLAWELGYSIAVPLVVLALAGRFLDKKLDTSPFLLLAGILVSIFISSYMVYKKTTDIMDRK